MINKYYSCLQILFHINYWITKFQQYLPQCLTSTSWAIFLRDELGSLCRRGTHPRNSNAANTKIQKHTVHSYIYWACRALKPKKKQKIELNCIALLLLRWKSEEIELHCSVKKMESEKGESSNERETRNHEMTKSFVFFKAIKTW